MNQQSSNSGKMYVNADKPIEDASHDELERSTFSKQLADAILCYSNKDNLTIGLYGQWGSGKTSILNMAKNELSAKPKDENKPIVVSFNPWNYSDSTQLISQFFQSLLSVIKGTESTDKMKKVGEALQTYSSLFQYTSLIPVFGKFLSPIQSVLRKVGFKLVDNSAAKETVESKKQEVIDALSDQSQKIIVFIDDIDRLNNKQIRLLFQLVNCVAGFPNMVYVLSFDKEVAARALQEEQNGSGEKYLEKIIQVSFEIPAINKNQLHKMFFK